MTKQELLGKVLGGTWKYDGNTTWWCDDGKRHVSRCSSGVDEQDNPTGPAQYFLYAEGESPRSITFGELKFFGVMP